MKGELSLVVDENLELVAHELAADVLDIIGHSGREHHNLFLRWGSSEDCLNITSHIY
jgi:hypothetical protein